ncbi:unnamed protein product, partial [Arabidopsis halleri]
IIISVCVATFHFTSLSSGFTITKENNKFLVYQKKRLS